MTVSIRLPFLSSGLKTIRNFLLVLCGHYLWLSCLTLLQCRLAAKSCTNLFALWQGKNGFSFIGSLPFSEKARLGWKQFWNSHTYSHWCENSICPSKQAIFGNEKLLNVFLNLHEFLLLSPLFSATFIPVENKTFWSRDILMGSITR